MSAESWTDRLFGGFRKTSERLTENLAGIVGTDAGSMMRSWTSWKTR